MGIRINLGIVKLGTAVVTTEIPQLEIIRFTVEPTEYYDIIRFTVEPAEEEE